MMKWIQTVALMALCPLAVASDFEEKKGIVVPVKTGDAKTDERFGKQMHFSIFENGEHDLLYVGMNYGMMKNGDLVLSHREERIVKAKIEHLLYTSIILDIGDVIPENPPEPFQYRISSIQGWLK